MPRFWQKKWIWLLSGVLLLAVGAALLWWQAPRWGGLLPGRVQLALPAVITDRIATPLPTALPAPTLPAGTPLPTIAPLVAPTQTPTTQQTNQPTNQPTNTPAATRDAETAVPTPTNQPTDQPIPTPLPLPTAVRLESLEIIPQKFNNCGPANLSINLAFYGVDAPQLAIAADIRPTYDDRNVSPQELVDYVNKNTDLRAAMFAGGDLETLRRLLAAGFPVVVEKGLLPNAREGWMGHYLTVIGYDDQDGVMISFDTFLGPWDGSGLAEPYDAFTEFWRHFNYTFWLVYPPEREVELLSLLSPALREAESMWQAAGVRAQTDIAVNEEDPFAWFNLGTALIRLAAVSGERQYATEAVVAFDQARLLGLPWRMLWYQFTPYEAYLAAGRHADVLVLTDATLSSAGGQFVEETYYYRGLAYAAAGDDARAAAAWARALELNPGFAAAADALE